MKKIVLIILISIFVFGCKTKKVLMTEIKEEETTFISELKKEDLKNIKNENIKENSSNEISKNKAEEKTEVNITGKVDKENPLSYYNIVNGDTVDYFKINGNADFSFKTYKNSLNSVENSLDNKESQKEIKEEKSISNAVENVKKAVKDVKQKTVEVVKKDVTIGSYFVFLIWGLVAIALCILILWLRKSNVLTKIFKL